MIKVKDRQSVLDVAIQTSGAIDSMMMIAELNDISITQVLNPEELLDVPLAILSGIIRDRLRNDNITLATDFTQNE